MTRRYRCLSIAIPFLLGATAHADVIGEWTASQINDPCHQGEPGFWGQDFAITVKASGSWLSGSWTSEDPRKSYGGPLMGRALTATTAVFRYCDYSGNPEADHEACRVGERQPEIFYYATRRNDRLDVYQSIESSPDPRWVTFRSVAELVLPAEAARAKLAHERWQKRLEAPSGDDDSEEISGTCPVKTPPAPTVGRWPEQNPNAAWAQDLRFERTQVDKWLAGVPYPHPTLRN